MDLATPWLGCGFIAESVWVKLLVIYFVNCSVFDFFLAFLWYFR